MRGKTSADQLPKMKDGAYVLQITPRAVNIYADTPSGHYYGLQTLLQLIDGAEKIDGGVVLSCAVIEDAPRFAWRGFMLDESREFSGEVAVKRLLDVMAYYKLNKFHWHLTDTYAFPDSLKLPKNSNGRVIGIQANLWTETTRTQKRRDFMTFPRLLALAESAWTPKELKDFADFEIRLKNHLPQLKARGIHFYDPFTKNPEVKK